ncbi:MAG: hypothetical protein IIA87_02010 [Nanoarchaeota archaeon]|nr:hypothetical protein [Nanoarchaeota archaeon]
MIKKILIIFLLIITIQFSTAISIDMKQVYQPGETLIAEISGNILEPISKEDVEFKRRNVQVPFEYDIKKLDRKYYLYAILTQLENNYTLIIKDIVTTVNGVVQRIEFQQNFSTAGELVSYSINPGFVIAREDFELTITLNKDFEETISVDFPEEHEVLLEPGENTLRFSIEFAEAGFRRINIGIYSVPLLIVKEPEKQIIILPEFRFFPDIIESTLLIDQEGTYPFRIINFREQDLTNIIFEYDTNLFEIFPEPIELLSSNEVAEFNLTLKVKNQPISETILVRSGNLTIELPINIQYTENIEEVETPYLEQNFSESQAYYCSELNGKFCSAEEVCSLDVTSALDGNNCCIGTCSTPKEKTSYAWVGYLLGAIVLIILIIIIARYYKTKRQGNPLKK